MPGMWNQTPLAVLADGTIYACRRFNRPIGNIKNEDLYEVFKFSETLNQLRDIKMFEKCRDCEINQYCRGCPAVAHGSSGSFLGADPQCWKKV